MEPEQMHNAPHGDDRSTRIGRVTGQPERRQEPRDLSRPAFPRAAERAGVTTSAMSRDGARLRTVMTRAVERNAPQGAASLGEDEWRADHEVAYRAPQGESAPAPATGIPMPELNATEDTSHAQETAAEHQGYRATRLVIPSSGRASSTYGASFSSEDSFKEATRLRSVTSLDSFKPEAKSPEAAAAAGNDPSSAGPADYEWKGPARSGSGRETPGAHSSYEDVWEAAATAASPRVASDGWSGARRERERREGSFRKGAMAFFTVIAGTAVGIGLYAGGSEYLSDIFSNKNEGVEMVSPSTVTERPQSTTPDVASSVPSGITGTDSGGTHRIDSATAARYDAYAVEDRIDAARDEAPAPKTPAAQPPVVANLAEKSPSKGETAASARGTESSRSGGSAATAGDTPKKAEAQNKEKGSGKKEEKGAELAKKEQPASSTGKYVVQVRATSDESEANLIAKKLRKKGISNVQIVRSEKNGAPFFRVRFTAAGTGSDLQAKAKSAGFADAWVVKQK